MWSAYDCIVSISEAAAKSFTTIFPSLREKVLVIENILPIQLIKKQMNEFDALSEMSGQGIKLLSIGRYCNAKNFDNVPNICSHILQLGIDVTWYIIGFGGDETLIRAKIKEEHMEKNVILLGKKENPYPYMKACDVYVQPSRYEGKSVAVREAQLLGKPVVITNYATADSQLEDGVDGMIVPLENEKCACAIAELLKDKSKTEQLSQACAIRDYSNYKEIKKVYDLFE